MYQSLTIVGNLTSDPEMRYLSSGTPVTSLNVATNRTYTGSDGQKVKEVAYFRVSVFGKVAESTSQYLKKGDPVLVEGRLTPDKNTGGPRTYQKKDGSFGSSYEVFANTVRFLPKKDGGKQDQSTEPEEDAF
jgi:single-strand DNA-binding protein